MKIREAVDQPKSMRTVTWPDQHGRPWDVTIDKDAFTHCTPPIPRFRAPLDVPLQYVTTHPDRMGRVRIDYAAWEAEWEAAEDTWRQRRTELLRHEKDEGLVAEIVGDMPQSVEFVRAARAGNRWVLGLPSKVTGRALAVPPWAESIVDRLRPRATQRRDLAAARADARRRYVDVETEETPAPAAAPSPFPDADDAPDGADARVAAAFQRSIPDGPTGFGDEDEEEGDDFGLSEDGEDEPLAGFGGDDDDLDDDLDEAPPAAAPVVATRARGKRTARGG